MTVRIFKASDLLPARARGAAHAGISIKSIPKHLQGNTTKQAPNRQKDRTTRDGAPEHFPTKWIPVGREKMRQNTNLEHFADKCDRLSAKEARPNKDLERRSDSIGTQKALEQFCDSDRKKIAPEERIKAFPFPFGLGRDGVQVVAEARYGDATAATGFALAAALCSSTIENTGEQDDVKNNQRSFKPSPGAGCAPILWISQYNRAREHGLLSPAGLANLLGPIDQPIIFVRTRRNIDTLLATEEAIGSGAVGLVVTDLDDVDFTASRRLTLASKRYGTPAIILAPHSHSGATALSARWRVQPAPSGINSYDARAPGTPRWCATLERSRTAPHHVGRNFIIEYDNETLSLHMVTQLATDPAHAYTNKINETNHTDGPSTSNNNTTQREGGHIIQWPVETHTPRKQEESRQAFRWARHE
ncbi:MAG: hypothetical protein AAF720_14025 [Pseudomonadota bacterium]